MTIQPNTPPAATRRDFLVWRSVFALYALIVIAQAAFQFFINSDDWRHAGIAGSDGQAYYAWVRSAVIDHDLDFENEIFEHNYNRHGFATRDSLPRSPSIPSATRPDLGRIFNRYGIGFGLFHLPFFLLAHAVAHLASALHAGPACTPDGYSLPYQIAVPIGTIFWGLLAFWTTRRILLRHIAPPIATATVLVLFLSYQGAFPVIQFWCNPHPQSLLVFNLMLLIAGRISPPGRLTQWAALGALTGLGALLRTEQLAFALLPATLALLFTLRAAKTPHPSAEIPAIAARGAICLAVCAAILFLQIAAWRSMWGAWGRLAMNNPGEHFQWTAPHLLPILFSTRHGLFYWSPVLLIGTIGLASAIVRRRLPTAIAAALPVLLALTYVYASWNIWWMGYSFGARQFISLTAFFAVGLGYIFKSLWKRPLFLAALSCALVGWNQIMLWMFLNAHIPRSEGFPPIQPFIKALELIRRTIGK